MSSPSLCVLSGLAAERLEAEAVNFGVTIKRYYIPLSEMPGCQGLQRIGGSSPFFRTCAALPSDPSAEEFDMVIDVVQQISRNRR
jgi:hypothetical protein